MQITLELDRIQNYRISIFYLTFSRNQFSHTKASDHHQTGSQGKDKQELGMSSQEHVA